MDRYAAENKDIGVRLDVFVQGRSGLSRNAVQRLIEKGDILVNGAAAKANYRLQKGDCIDINLPAPLQPDILPENIPLNIVYEDADLIVIDKPKGMVVHPAPGHYSGTLVNALLYHCQKSLSGINGVLRPGIVHRLDKDTSGLLVAAKNDAAHKVLAEQFAGHTIKREYLAIVCGGFKDAAGTIDAPIARHRTDRKKMAVVPGGRRAVTHFEVIKSLGKFTLVKCTLETGRTHQIRVHMASINRPVLGDAVYGPAKQPAGTNGQVLHARLLGFTHPDGRSLCFTSPPPDYFEAILLKYSIDLS